MHKVSRERLLTKVSLQSYAGVYHTDHTIPAEFFEDNNSKQTLQLSFAYLHDPTDPEFHRIGLGIPISD
jgi:hypothetical protein